jgi:GAF domain-containing protein
VGGLLLGGRATIIIAVIFSIVQIVITQLASMGVIHPILATQTPASGTVLVTVGYFLAAFTFRLATDSIQTTLLQVRNSERKLFQSNQKLEEAAQGLEVRVQERTAALDKRARQLEAISNVARSIASMQNTDELLSAVARLVSERFGYYHVGIFLTDENREYAILQATNSTGGQKMLDRQHKLKLDTSSIVGFVTSRGEPRIALDVGSDSYFFNNPDLPATRSEIALPLRIGGRTIGALDAQSTEPNAFSQEDAAILATLADQVAIAIENSRLFSESRKALFESQATFERYTKQEWSSFSRQAKQTGFVYDGRHVQPLDDKSQREKAKTIQTGRLSLNKTSSTLAIPIKLRGQTIGMLDVRPKKGTREWTQDEITLLETAAERAALALENARLVESAQRRASRERTIGEISAKIGSVTDLETIMQTAVEELGRKIGGTTEVVLEIVTENDNGKQA